MKYSLLSTVVLTGLLCLYGCGILRRAGLTPHVSTGTKRFYALGREAKESFESGEYAKARVDAQELALVTPTYVGNWNYGNAIQDANIVLGRLALRDGKLEEAKKYLLAAGNSPGSPQMDSFGPNMSLANDLLAKGEKTVVLKFFKECEKFWDPKCSSLEQWSTDVKAGRTPDFGPNLIY
jgi:hypothetical protein